MTATPFKVINFNPDDLIGDDKMDAIVNNTQWLYENTPRATYTLSDSTVRSEGVRMACGRITIPPNKADHAGASVNFPNFFSPGCLPVITTGIVTNGDRRVFCIINGLGERLQPDYTGFQVWVNIDSPVKANDRIAHTFYINWQAMGY